MIVEVIDRDGKFIGCSFDMNCTSSKVKLGGVVGVALGSSTSFGVSVCLIGLPVDNVVMLVIPEYVFLV